MNYKVKLLVGGLLLLVIAMTGGCQNNCGGCEPAPLDDCEYVTFEGTVEIISVNPSSIQEVTCTAPLEVVYTFTPNDPNAINNYTHPDFSDANLVCGDIYCSGTVYIEDISPGIYYYTPVAQEWADRVGLTVGSRHVVNRVEEIGSGSCFPVTFEWVELESYIDGLSDQERDTIPICGVPVENE